jgi:hypothetical protein
MRTTKISELTPVTGLVGAEPLPVVQSGRTKSATQTQIRRATIKSVSADYTILDDDPDIIEVTTGAADVTITLPTLADNVGARKKIVKVDDGAGKVIVDGEGAEPVNGGTMWYVGSQYGFVTVDALSTLWLVTDGKYDGPVSGELSVGTFHPINPAGDAYKTNPAEGTNITVDCSDDVPAGAKAVLLTAYYLRAGGYLTIYFSSSGTPSLTNYNDVIIDYGSAAFMSRQVFTELSSQSFVFNVADGTCGNLYLKIIGYYI